MYFSTANFTAKRRHELKILFSRTAVAMAVAGSLLLPSSLYLAALLDLTSLMLAVLTGGIDVSDRILTKKERHVPCHFRMVKTYISQTCASARIRCYNRTRSHRSASRPTFSKNSKSNSDSGESDSGDPPGPLPSVTPSSGYKQSNCFSLPWRRPGYWRMVCETCGRRRFA